MHRRPLLPPQEDLFIPTLTPREHLRFHANLRMDASIAREDKMKAVEQALEGLGLGEFLQHFL